MLAYTIFIFGRITHALFDNGASHSFISTAYVKLFKLAMEMLEESMYVATIIGRSLVADQVCKSCNLSKKKKKVCKSCKLRIGSSKFFVNLIVLGINDFNVILGMDRLSVNFVQLIAEKNGL